MLSGKHSHPLACWGVMPPRPFSWGLTLWFSGSPCGEVVLERFGLTWNVSRSELGDVEELRITRPLRVPLYSTQWLVLELYEGPLFAWEAGDWFGLPLLSRIQRYHDGWRPALVHGPPGASVRLGVIVGQLLAGWAVLGRVLTARVRRRCWRRGDWCSWAPLLFETFLKTWKDIGLGELMSEDLKLSTKTPDVVGNSRRSYPSTNF